jgi:hypothetical protein
MTQFCFNGERGDFVRLKMWTIAILVGINAGCDLCGNQEISRLPSPDGKLEAVIFGRDCGATTDFTTQISIVAKGASVQRGSGNTFIGDSNHGATPRARWGGPPVDVKWVTNRQVMISTHPATRITVQESAVSVRMVVLSHDQVQVQYSSSLP